MEYSRNTAFDDAVVCADGETEGLSAGTYYVRRKATSIAEAGKYTTVVIRESAHSRQNGICTLCGGFEAATLNNNSTAGNTADDYYEIGNAGQLYWFASFVNSGNTSVNAVLTANIDNVSTLTRLWTPIGVSEDKKYNGTFNGNGFTLSGLYYSDNDSLAAGLFGYIGENGKVCNTGIINSSFTAKSGVAAVAGVNVGNIEDCYSTSTVYGESGAGGICGTNSGNVTNCYNTGLINITDVLTTVKYNLCGAQNGIVSNSYFLYNTEKSDGENALEAQNGGGTVKTAEKFSSGEVCYLLNGQTSEGEVVWHQNIDNGQLADSTPVFSGATVYRIGSVYANNNIITPSDLTKTTVDHTKKYVITDLFGVTDLDSLFIYNPSYTFSSTASGIVGTGSTFKLSKDGVDTVYTVVVKGDVNGDGVCDVLDCSKVSNAQNGTFTPNDVQLAAIDLNGNDEIDGVDYQQLVNKALS